MNKIIKMQAEKIVKGWKEDVISKVPEMAEGYCDVVDKMHDEIVESICKNESNGIAVAMIPENYFALFGNLMKRMVA